MASWKIVPRPPPPPPHTPRMTMAGTIKLTFLAPIRLYIYRQNVPRPFTRPPPPPQSQCLLCMLCKINIMRTFPLKRGDSKIKVNGFSVEIQDTFQTILSYISRSPWVQMGCKLYLQSALLRSRCIFIHFKGTQPITGANDTCIRIQGCRFAPLPLEVQVWTFKGAARWCGNQWCKTHIDKRKFAPKKQRHPFQLFKLRWATFSPYFASSEVKIGCNFYVTVHFKVHYCSLIGAYLYTPLKGAINRYCANNTYQNGADLQAL